MRTIKFRGKSLITGEWKYGNLTIKTERFNFVKSTLTTAFVDDIDVNPETVGQFTGLYDKHDEEIYEGDILTFKLDDGYHHGGSTYIGVAKWNDEISSFCYYIYGVSDKGQDELLGYGNYMHMHSCNEYEILGNEVDNPELLKENS